MQQQSSAASLCSNGFSDEQQLTAEDIQIKDSIQYESSVQKENQVQIKKYLAEMTPSRPIIDKSYSLAPDMVFGWCPKITFSGPIPLMFENYIVDSLTNHFSRNDYSKEYQLCYLGYRPHNTLKVHEKFSGQNSYPFKYEHLYKVNQSQMNPFFKMFYHKYPEVKIQPFEGNNPKYNESQYLRFDSIFEGGNLDLVIKVAPYEYDLFIRSDTNTRGHTLWYYFKINGMEKGKKYKFNICNCSKKKTLYMRGMKPYIYSEKQNNFNNKKWEQGGDNVKFELKNLRYNEFVYDNYDDDSVYFAYSIPYTYSMLLQFINKLTNEHDEKKQNFLKNEKLCQSLAGLDLPLLTITDLSDYKLPIEQRKVIIINGRVHPGETNGSWMVQGLLEYLVSNEEKVQDLRKTCVFKIVPMLNPDGVLLGNYRTGITGKDLNREFYNPEKMFYPTVSAMKELFEVTKKAAEENFIMFLDMHGHSVKKNVFVYGPEFPIFDLNYYKCRVFPKLIDQKSKMFRYYASSFKVSSEKQNTARAIVLKQFKVPYSFTVEASNGSYYTEGQHINFTAYDFIQMGHEIGNALQLFICGLCLSEQLIKERKRQKILLQKDNNEQKKLFRKKNLTRYDQKVQKSTNKQCITVDQNAQNQVIKERSQSSIDDKLFYKSMSEIQQVKKTHRNKCKSQNEQIIEKCKKKKKRDQQINKEQQMDEIDIWMKASPFDKIFEVKLKLIYNENQEIKNENDNLAKINKGNQDELRQDTINSDDNISEGGSDSESSQDDLDIGQQQILKNNIQQNKKIFLKTFYHITEKETKQQIQDQKLKIFENNQYQNIKKQLMNQEDQPVTQQYHTQSRDIKSSYLINRKSSKNNITNSSRHHQLSTRQQQLQNRIQEMRPLQITNQELILQARDNIQPDQSTNIYDIKQYIEQKQQFRDRNYKSFDFQANRKQKLISSDQQQQNFLKPRKSEQIQLINFSSALTSQKYEWTKPNRNNLLKLIKNINDQGGQKICSSSHIDGGFQKETLFKDILMKELSQQRKEVSNKLYTPTHTDDRYNNNQLDKYKYTRSREVDEKQYQKRHYPPAFYQIMRQSSFQNQTSELDSLLLTQGSKYNINYGTKNNFLK